MRETPNPPEDNWNPSEKRLFKIVVRVLAAFGVVFILTEISHRLLDKGFWWYVYFLPSLF